jgi:hypothetical protein
MRNRTISISVVVLLLALANGVTRQVISPGQVLPQVDIAFALVSIALAFIWFRGDANERGYQRSLLRNAIVIAFAIVALPYYLFRTRGAVRGLAATGVFIAITVAYSVLEYAGEYAVYLMQKR